MAKNKKIKVGQIWLDYLPQSFIEPQPFLNRSDAIESYNLIFNLVKNNKTLDHASFYFSSQSHQAYLQPSFLQKVKNKILRPHDLRHFQAWLASHIQSLNLDLIHFHFGTTASSLYDLIEELNLPMVVSFYGYDASAALHNFSITNNYQRIFLKNARAIVLCQAVRDRLRALNIANQKIVQINLPAQVERYQYYEKNYSKNRRLKIICCARFIEKKGHFTLLEAIAILRNSYHLEIELTVMGYGTLKVAIVKYAEQLKVHDLLTVIDTQVKTDFHQQYNEILKHHDLFVLASTTAKNGDDEGGPALTMIGAQAAGLPVVCTRFAGAEVSMIDGQTGYYCRENDAHDLAAKIKLISEQSQNWSAMGRLSQQIVTQEFSETIQMNKLIGLYHSMI